MKMIMEEYADVLIAGLIGTGMITMLWKLVGIMAKVESWFAGSIC